MTKVNRNLQRQARSIAASSSFSYQQALRLIVGDAGKETSNIFLQEETWLQRAVINHFRKRGFKDDTLAHFQIKAETRQPHESKRGYIPEDIMNGYVRIPVFDDNGDFYANAWQHALAETLCCNHCGKHIKHKVFYEARKGIGQVHSQAGQELISAITKSDGPLLTKLTAEYLINGYPHLTCPECKKQTSTQSPWLTEVYLGVEIESHGDRVYPSGSLSFASLPLYNYHQARISNAGSDCEQLLLTPGINETWAAWQAGQTFTCSYIADEISYAAGEEVNIYANKMKLAAQLAQSANKPIVVLPEFYHPKKREERLHFVVDFLRAANPDADILLLTPSPLLKPVVPLSKHEVDSVSADYLTDLQQQEGSKAVAHYIATCQVPATSENMKQVFKK